MLNGLDVGERIKREMPMTKLGLPLDEHGLRCCCRCISKGSFSLRNETIRPTGIGACRQKSDPRKIVSISSHRAGNIDSLLNNKRVPQTQIFQRQTEILQLLAEGRSIKQIAGVLEIRPGTVAFHKYRMMKRLNVKSNAELLGYAMKCRMMSSEAASF